MSNMLAEFLALLSDLLQQTVCVFVPVEEYRNGMKVICQHQQWAFSEFGICFLAVAVNQLTDRALKLRPQHSAPQYGLKTYLEREMTKTLWCGV